MSEAVLETLLSEGLAQLGLQPDAAALPRLRRYYELLEEQSKVMNLTAIHGEADVARLHFLDCAALLSLVPLEGRVIDVGSGAGFPGLVLKILRPELELTLLDSLDKRVRFLAAVCGELELHDVQCLHARAEEAPAQLRESFDAAVSRAVARLDLLSELCLPFVRPGGRFVAMKGPGAVEELEAARRAISLLGGEAEGCKAYPVPGTELNHCAVLVKKIALTPKKYPRKWGQMKKQPL